MIDTIAEDMDAETPASEPVAIPATAAADSGVPAEAPPNLPTAPEAPETPQAPANE